MSTATELYARLTPRAREHQAADGVETSPGAIADETSAEPLTSTPGLIVCTDVSFDYGRANAAAGREWAEWCGFLDATMSDELPRSWICRRRCRQEHRPEHAARHRLRRARGERAAIGGSGCGKSSLLKLIPRPLRRQRRPHRDRRPRRARAEAPRSRHAVSFVPQEPILFHGTLYENPRHGSQSATRDMARRRAGSRV